MNLFDVTVKGDHLEGKGFKVPLDEKQQKTLKSYVNKEIILGVRPENLVEGTDIPVKVTSNENLGMNTLVHGHISDGNKTFDRITCKLRGWCNYKPGDIAKVSINRMHFFDKETTNSIFGEDK